LARSRLNILGVASYSAFHGGHVAFAADKPGVPEMTALSAANNPFLMMVQPEVVLAAIEKSEKLGRLNRRLCRPLDRPLIPATARADGQPLDDVDSESDDEV
jgi:hypothetical protein